MRSDLESHLIALEQSLHDPQVRASQLRLDALIADDFVETGATGVTFGKDAVLSGLQPESGVRFVGVNFNVRILSSTVGLVTYESTKHSANTVTRSKRSSIWALRGDRWQMVYHQGTLLA